MLLERFWCPLRPDQLEQQPDVNSDLGNTSYKYLGVSNEKLHWYYIMWKMDVWSHSRRLGVAKKNGQRDGLAMAHPAHPADTALLSWAHEGFPSPSPLREAG